MKKPFNLNFRRPRRSDLLLARALLFAVTIALSSSDEDVNVSVKSADIPNHLAAHSRLDKREIAQLLEQAQRELQTESERSKSSKGGSKSASKGSKKQHSKSKSGKGKSGKSKSGKSKSGKSKSAKANGKSGKGKSGKGKGKGGKSISAKGSKSAKSKAGKSEPEEESEDESSAHSANSHDSQEYIAATSFDGAELDARTKNAPSPGSEGSEGSVASPSTAEDPDTESATSIMSSNSNGNLPVEETKGTRSEATATSYDGWVEPSAGVGDGESSENEEVVKMDVDLMDESNINDRDISGGTDAQSNDNFEEEQNNAITETTALSKIPEEEHVDESSVDMPNLHKDHVEVRIEENEDMESEE